MSSVRTWPGMALGLIAACVLAEAAMLPIGIDDLDEGYFVQQAARVLHGQVPYRDFETLYSPGLAYVHATLFAALGGASLLGVRVVALLGRAALVGALYLVARPLVRQPMWAALPAVFLLIGLDDAPERWEPHPGWLSTLFAVLAAWCVGHGVSKAWLIATGACCAIAYAFKQNTGLFMLLAALVWLAAFRHSQTRTDNPPHAARRAFQPSALEHPVGTERARRAGLLLASFGATTAVWLVPLLVVMRGNLAALGVLVGAVNTVGLVSPPEPSIGVPLACAASGVWLARTRPDPRLRWFLLAGAALFATQYPRMDTLHLAWSAPLLLVLGAASLARAPRPAAALALAALALVAAPILAARLAFVAQPRAPIAGVEAPVQTAADLRGVVADIQGRTRPGEPIFVYPTSPLVYALAERPNPTRFDHLNPGAATPAQIQAVMRDLSAARVSVVVISDFWAQSWGPPGPNAPLEDWLEENFADAARYGAYRVLTARL